MATGTFYPAVSGDDGYSIGYNFYTHQTVLGRGSGTAGYYYSFICFKNLTIRQGETITAAHIRLYAKDYSSISTKCKVWIRGNDEDDAIPPTTRNENLALTTTSAIVVWSNITSWSITTPPTGYNSPDISSVIQEIIDRAGWVSGNDLQIILKGDNLETDWRSAYGYADYDALNPTDYIAELHIEYGVLGELGEAATSNDSFDAGVENLSEDASATEDIDTGTVHLQPFHGVLDEEASASASFDAGDPAALDESATASDSFEDGSPEIEEDVYANDFFEISPFEYTLDVTETGWAIDDFDVPNHGELDENVSSDDSIYSLLDGLDESASSSEMFSFVYELDISEDALADDDDHLLLVESLEETVDIDETVNRWLGMPITESFSANDTPQPGWNLSATTTGALTSTASNIWGLPIKEWLTILDTPGNLWTGVETISDAFVAQDTIERIEYLLEATSTADLSGTAKGWLYILLSEWMGAVDTATGNLTIDLSATTEGDLESEVLQHLHFAVATEMDLSGLTRGELVMAIESAVDAAGTLTGNYTFAGVVESLLVVLDSVSRVFDLTATTEGDLSSTAQAQLLLQILEAVEAASTVSDAGVFNHTATSTIDVKDTVRVQILLAALTEMGFDSLATLIAVPDEALLSSLELADTLESMGAFGLSVASITDLAETARPALQFLATSTLAAASTAVLKQWMIDSVTSSVAAASTATDTLYTYPSIAESLVLVSTATGNGVYYNTVQSALRLSITVVVDGETWECYVLNTPKFMPSIYTGFDFNSYAVFENRAYGANSDGIYELTGTTDAGDDIQTAAVLSETDFDIGDKKRFRKAYLGVSGSSPVMIMESDDGLRRVYTIDEKGQVDATRELVGKEWTLTVSDFDRLDYIRLVPVLLARGR